MPRKICEKCCKNKITYRIYIDNGKGTAGKYAYAQGKSKLEICKQCAVRFLCANKVFNLRKICRADLGTARPTEDFFHD